MYICPMNNFTNIQGVEVREKIMQFLIKNEVRLSPVSFREIAEALGGDVSTSVVEYHLGVLQDQGKIKREPKKSRLIRVIHEGEK